MSKLQKPAPMSLSFKITNILSNSGGRALTYGAIASVLRFDYRTDKRYFNIQYALNQLVEGNVLDKYTVGSGAYAKTAYSMRNTRVSS